jgi:hypothetical protein
MIGSNSVYFLGFHRVTAEKYMMEVRLDSKVNIDEIFKCHLLVEKKNGQFEMVSVTNFQKKEREKVMYHHLPWNQAHLSEKQQQSVLTWLSNDQAFMEVLREGKWLASIVRLETRTKPPFHNHRIDLDVLSTSTHIGVELDTGDTFLFNADIYECKGQDFLDHVRLVKYDINDKQAMLQNRKDAYLGQLLSKEILKSLKNKVRIGKLFI